MDNDGRTFKVKFNDSSRSFNLKDKTKDKDKDKDDSIYYEEVIYYDGGDVEGYGDS